MTLTRYEIKFPVNHAQKERFLDAARYALTEDPHGENACYRVTSVYFDSRGLDFFWEKVDGIAIRRKVRLRCYGEFHEGNGWEDRPYFLEIKHRIKDSVYKERVRVTAEGARRMTEDASVICSARDFVTGEERAWASTIATLESLQARWQLVPTNAISYRREAWVGVVDERLRLTFDQMATVHEPDNFQAASLHRGLPIIPPGHYVMEIKFNDVIPRWMRDIIAEQNLLPRRFSKYASGASVLGLIPRRSLANRESLGNPFVTGQAEPLAAPRVPPVCLPAELPSVEKRSEEKVHS